MHKVTFISRRGRSDLPAAVAIIFAVKYNLRTLVLHDDGNLRTERTLSKERKDISSDNLGLEELERLYMSRKLTPESVKDNSRPILRTYLDIVKKDADIPIDALKAIIAAAAKQYELVIIDMQGSHNQGPDRECPNRECPNRECPNRELEMVKVADLAVCTLDQDLMTLQKFFEGEYEILQEHAQAHVLVLEDYDHDSKYTIRKLSRHFNVKDMYPVARCTEFKDAVNDRDVANFIRRAFNARKDHPNRQFIKDCDALVNVLMNKLGMPPTNPV